VTIDRGAGLGLTRPTLPLGFAVLDSSDPFATPLDIVDYSWSFSTYDILTITTDTDDAGALPVYPYGSCWEMAEAPTRIVGNLDSVTAQFRPLLTYHATA
jgi:hypothetical protein